jgi:ATP adenylyltransferase
MKILWAPWRIEYILSKKPPGCIFCDIPKEAKDRENLILGRRENTYAIMNLYPYNNGHIMIVPFFHTSTFDGLTDDVLKEMLAFTKFSVDCLKKAMRPEGFNIGINIGSVAGAGIEEHIHIHIVPRWAGDTSFMTVLGEARVIPEHLFETYDKLLPLFSADA